VAATPDILVEAHPHIGTNKLPQIIQDIREKISNVRAGTVRNSSDGYCSENNEVQGIVTQNGDTILANKMILATGHSARDIFELLDRKKYS
jgi:uncharacterized FAD-dependent dehydrogenase